jgi:predicted nucleotidyltransferase
VDQGLREVLTTFFAAQPAVVSVYVFGSVARGEANTKSDLDLAILFDQPPSAALMGPRFSLASDVERLVGRPVDLTVLNGADADLVHRVLRDGDLILDRNPSARIQFEVASRREYFDLAPIRREYRRLAHARF